MFHKSRCFFSILLVVQILMIVTLAYAQTDAQKMLPVSRLMEAKGVRWTALQSVKKAVVHIQPTLTKSAAKLKLSIPGYETGVIQRENVEFRRFDIPGAGITSVVSKPELPVVRRFVAVPEGAKISVQFTPGKPVILSDVNVYPVQEPLPEQPDNVLPDKPITFAFDRDFYKLNQSYPAKLVNVSEPMKIRNITVVMVEVAVMQYNPGSRSLSIYPEMTVDLSFSMPFETRIKGRTPETRQQHEKNSTAFDKITSYLKDKIIINWDVIKDILAHQKWNYLIITPDIYYDEIQPIVQWKRDKGLIVKMTKLSTISVTPTAEQIRDYIKKAYEDHAVEYVLLVGDTDTLPGYYYPDCNGTVSDYYYTLISGSDYLPDVALGRFSGRSKSEISNMVSKSVNYEKIPAAGDWKKRAVCISDSGYFQDTSDYNCNLLASHGFTVDKIYASLNNATVDNVSSDINNGRLLVSYRGHGGPTGWVTTGFSNTNVTSLTNGSMLPVIISPTCLTGEFDYASSNCFSETWAKGYGAAAPLGAVAYWGSARISYGGYNDELSKGAFDDMLASGDHVIGNVVNNAKLHMLSQYGISDSTALLELYMFNLFGDPELKISFAQ